MSAQYAIGLAILGLPDPLDPTANGVCVYTTRPLDGVLPLTIGSGGPVQIRPMLDTDSPVSGVSISSDIRDPVKGASAIRCTLVDQDDTLAALFAADVGLQHTTYIDLTQTKVDSTDTSLTISEPAFPANGIYYLEGEAVRITGSTLQTLAISRAQNGSRARVHRIRPQSYAPGDDGLTECLSLTSRPDFDGYHFEVELYLFDVVADKAVSVVWARKGYLARRPVSTGDGRWQLEVEDVTKQVEEHRLEAPEVSLSHKVRVLELGYDTSGVQALDIMLTLPRYEVERLIGEPYHEYGVDAVDPEMIDEYFASDGLFFATTHKVQLHIELECGGHKYVYRIVPPAQGYTATSVLGSAFGSGFFNQTYALLYCRLVGHEAGTQVAADGVQPGSGVSLNDGWYLGPAGMSNSDPQSAPVQVLAGSAQPKAKLRIYIEAPPMEAMLYMLHSDAGDGTTDATYDVIPGGYGLGLFGAQVNQGSPSGDPLGVSDETTEILQLNELLPQVYQYPIELDQDLKEWMESLCRVHTLLMGTDPDTGALLYRLWSKVQPSSPIDISPIAVPLKGAQVLEPLRAITVDIGFDQVSLDPVHEGVSIRAKGAQARHLKDAQKLRLWTDYPGAQLTQFTQVALGRAILSFFGQLQGEPTVYPVETFIGDRAAIIGDVVRWSDPSIAVVTPAGHGVLQGRFLVTGIELDLMTGVQVLSLLPDLINSLSGSRSKTAPLLRITAINSITPSGSDYICSVDVESIIEGSLNLATAHGGIWATLAATARPAIPWVRLLNLDRHNPYDMTPITNASKERRPGWLEAYLEVSAILGPDTLQLILPGSWVRGGLTAAQIVETGCLIQLTDRRAAEMTYDGIAIIPILTQLYNAGLGLDFAKVGPPSGLPFDMHLSLWSVS